MHTRRDGWWRSRCPRRPRRPSCSPPNSMKNFSPASIDLRGLLCPVALARTKYALSKLAAGEELRVIVHHRPALPDVERNAEGQAEEVPSFLGPTAGAWEMVPRACRLSYRCS